MKIVNIINAGILVLLFSCCSQSEVRNFPVKTLNVKVIEGSSAPLVDRSHPGSHDNGSGYENGYTIYHNGAYHMLITEMFKDGESGVGYWIPARIGYWTSADGNTWNRHSTIVEGNNIKNDMRECTWSSSFYWNEDENRWNIFWRGTDAVFRYQSSVEGDEGIMGPYEEAKCIIAPGGERGNILWYSGFLHSFGNIFKSKNNDDILYTFFCDLIHENGYANWPAGMLYSKNGVDGDWKYLETSEPIFNFAENPFVSIYDGIYLAPYDDLSHSHSIGIGCSEDGLNWKRVIVDLEGYIPWAEQINLVSTVRTPLGLVRNADGNYTVFFTAYSTQSEYFAIGKIRLKIDIIKMTKKDKDREKYKLNLKDDELWTGINGKWHNEYDGLSIFETNDMAYVRTYNKQAYKNFEAEVTLRAVGIALENRTFSETDARAGLTFGKKNPDTTLETDDYNVYVDANKKLVLAKGNSILKEVDIQQNIFIYRTLKAIVKNGKLSVYFAGNTEPVLEYKLQDYSGGYVALFAGKEHIHFESMYLKKDGHPNQ